MELMDCPNLAVPPDVMQHVVKVESSYNPYAIGVVGGRLQRQPKTLSEALATVRMLEGRGFNFSLGLAQVNRHNLAKYGLTSYEHAFQACPNVVAGSRILAECHGRSGQDWGKSFSCYYSGNFTTGFRHGYVQKIYASMHRGVSPVRRATESLEVVADAPRPAATGRVAMRIESDVSSVQRAAPVQRREAEDGAISRNDQPVRVTAVANATEMVVATADPQPQSQTPPAVAAPSGLPRAGDDDRDSAFVF